MKQCASVVSVLAALLCIAPNRVAADGDFGQKLGLKVWTIDMEFQWPYEDKVTGDGVIAGVTTSLDFPEDFWLSFYCMFGDLQFGTVKSSESLDVELLFCKTLDMFALGLGARHWATETIRSNDTESDYTLFGPMLYVGLGDVFGESPLGWYTSATWMFLDLEEDWDDGRHYILEAGLFLALDPVTATLGYRRREHYSQDNDLVYHGVTASVVATIW